MKLHRILLIMPLMGLSFWLSGCAQLQSLTGAAAAIPVVSDTAIVTLPEDEIAACLFAPDDYLYYCRLLEQTLIQCDSVDLDLVYGDLEQQYSEIQNFTNTADTSLLELKRQYTRELTELAGRMLGVSENGDAALLKAGLSTESPGEWDQDFSRFTDADIDSILYALLHIPAQNLLPTVPDAAHELVDAKVDFLTGAGRKSFTRWLSRSSRYLPLLQEIINAHNLPPDLVYLAMIESGFSSKAYSWAHAAGPWQFIGSTAKIFGLRRDYWVDERYDLIASTHAAARFLRVLYNRYQDWYLAFAAYNAGPGRVDRALKRHGTRDYWQLWSLPRETRNYVPMFLAARKITRHPERYGFTAIEYQEPLVIDTLRVEGGYRLQDIAAELKLSSATLQELNPALLREVTPPGETPALLKLPAGSADALLAALPTLPKAADTRIVTRHKVRYGETLSSIALRYGVSVRSLRQANDLRGSRIYAGKTLVVMDAADPIRSGGGQEFPQNGGRATKYRVKRGDTLSEIALRYGLTVSKIRKWNGIGRQGKIYAGQNLVLYLSGDAPAGDAVVLGEWLIHTVKRGENASLLAERYGVSLRDLRSWNNLDRKLKLLVGQKLKVGRIDQDRVIEYRVRQGDSLWLIAERHHVTTAEIQQWNNLGKNDKIFPGDKLVIHTRE